MIVENDFFSLGWSNKPKLDEIEIQKMDHQKYKNYDACMDHEFGKKRGMRPSFNSVSFRPCNPVLNLKDRAIKDMDNETGE
jgi:hypothetical protein